MANDEYILLRFRRINDWCVRVGTFTAGWPTFRYQIDPYGRPWLTGYEHCVLRDDVVDWRDVPAAEYAANDVPSRFTGAHDYAIRQGYQHGFPNGHQAIYDEIVYGTFLIIPGTCEWRDVPTGELGLGYGDPSRRTMDRWFTGAFEYADRNGFRAGMPTGHTANYGQGWVCGVFLFSAGRVERRVIAAETLGLPG